MLKRIGEVRGLDPDGKMRAHVDYETGTNAYDGKIRRLRHGLISDVESEGRKSFLSWSDTRAVHDVRNIVLKNTLDGRLFGETK